MLFNMTVDLDNESIEVNWLMYKSYEAQRENSPHIEPKRWKRLYFFQSDYEKVYQAIKHSVHKGIDSVHKKINSVHKKVFNGIR